MSRTTLVHRQDTDKGSRYEWGHLFVEVQGKPGELRKMRAGVNEPTVGNSTSAASTPWLNSEHANVMSDLLRAAVVNAGGSACGGKTLLEMLWEELDAIMDRLMTGQEAEDERDPGRAEGVAFCIAVFQNPYAPNINVVRDQAMDRWEQQQAAPTPPAPAKDRAAMRRARRARRA